MVGVPCASINDTDAHNVFEETLEMYILPPLWMRVEYDAIA
jgi:hypothetical protein